MFHRQQDNEIVEFSVQNQQGYETPVDLPMAVADLMKIEVLPRLEANANSSIRFVARDISHDIPIPGTGVREAVNTYSQRFFLALSVFLVLGLIIIAWIAHRVSDPLMKLQTAAGRIAEGELGTEVQSHGVSEVNDTISAFNQMSQKLSELEASRLQWQENQHLSEIGDIGRGLAHSLRNPLNAIGLAVENLSARVEDDTRAREISAETRRQIRRIDDAIKSFLTLAQQGQTDSKPINLYLIATDIALELAQTEQAEIEIESHKEVSINGVEAEIRSMLQALIVNAVEAHKEANLKIPIQLSIHQHKDGMLVEVFDQGPGIAPSIIPDLFQPHATHKADGAGMGLYLTRRLARHRYQGEVNLQSAENNGTIARLFLKNRLST